MLAISVVLAHSGGFFGHQMIGGRPAVVLFFVISGFYMALILNTKYRGAGARLFYTSRILRLWPTYLAVMLGVVIAYAMAGILGLYIKQLQLVEFPFNLLAVLANVFLVGQDAFWFLGFDTATGVVGYHPYGSDRASNGYALLLNSPAFTISIEIGFYLLAPFVVTTFRRALGLLVVGAVYHLALRAMGISGIAYAYSLFPASLVYFGLGATAYWLYREEVRLERVSQYLGAGLLVAMILGTRMMLPTLEVLAFALAVPFIFRKTCKLVLDRTLGDLSYALYLVHFPIITLLRPHMPGIYLGAVSVAVSLVAAVVVYLLVERPIENFRARYNRSHGAQEIRQE